MKYGRYTLKANEMDDDGTFTVSAYLGRKLVGYAHIIDLKTHLEPYEMGEEAVLVYEDHRRQGLASAMYDFAEELCGKKMKPSSNQSVDGRLLWKHRSGT